MVVTLTAIVEFLGALILEILSYRFWQTFRERRRFISRLLFYFVGILALYFFLDSFLILFFAENSSVLKLSVIYAVIFHSLACATIAYLTMYIFSPKANPTFGFLFVFILGIGLAIFTIKTPFFPSLNSVELIRIGTIKIIE
jgi:hypothetical protein